MRSGTQLGLVGLFISVPHVAAQAWVGRCVADCQALHSKHNSCHEFNTARPNKACSWSHREGLKEACQQVCSGIGRRELSARTDRACNNARQAIPKPTMHKACLTGYESAYERVSNINDRQLRYLMGGQPIDQLPYEEEEEAQERGRNVQLDPRVAGTKQAENPIKRALDEQSDHPGEKVEKKAPEKTEEVKGVGQGAARELRSGQHTKADASEGSKNSKTLSAEKIKTEQTAASDQQQHRSQHQQQSQPQNQQQPVKRVLPAEPVPQPRREAKAEQSQHGHQQAHTYHQSAAAAAASAAAAAARGNELLHDAAARGSEVVHQAAHRGSEYMHGLGRELRDAMDVVGGAMEHAMHQQPHQERVSPKKKEEGVTK